MKQAATLLYLFMLMALAVACRQHSHGTELNSALSLCESDPDSALRLLDGIDREDLPQDELPAYCLAYTMAQDKSGLDVADDSLIRVAYDAYAETSLSQYYSRSQYYMGKYYALNDSTEKAISCFENAKDRALEERDTATVCLALERLSREILPYDQVNALEYARDAYRMYACYSRSNIRNKVFYKLQVGYCLMFVDSLYAAKNECKNAFAIAYNANDSFAMSNSCHDLALIFSNLGDNDSSLLYAKKMMKLWDDSGVSDELLLANAYYAADSITLAEDIYNKIVYLSHPIKNSLIYRNLQKIAIRKNCKEMALAYGDSAFEKLGTMYSASLEQRNTHYEKLLNQIREKNEAERIANRSKWIIGIALFVMCCIIYNYIMYRRRAQERVKEERERAELKLQHEKELHEQESFFRKEQYEKDLKSRELQIDIMQKYLMEKIKIAQKIKDVKEGKSKPIFTEDDWKDIEIFLENSECGVVSRLRAEFPELREKDVRLMMLLRVKMPQKSIAEYYGISEKAVKQKLFLYKEKVRIKDENMSLREYIEAY